MVTVAKRALDLSLNRWSVFRWLVLTQSSSAHPVLIFHSAHTILPSLLALIPFPVET